MGKCNWCGSELAPGVPNCLNCGVAVEPTVPCGTCGNMLVEGATVCPGCGQEILYKRPVQPTMAAPPGYGQPATGVPAPGSRARPASAATPPPAAGARKKELWMSGPKMDGWYVAAISVAILSGMFFWVPKVNIGVSFIALVLAGVGFIRYYKAPGEYGHVWVNVVAAVLALITLVVAIKVTMNAGSTKVIKPIVDLLTVMLG